MHKTQAILESSPFGIDALPSAPPAAAAYSPQPPLAPFQVGRGDTLPGYSRRPPQVVGAESSDSLYEASAWAKLWFLRIMLLTVGRLVLFVRKIIEDYSATLRYLGRPRLFGHFLISFSTLFLPTIIFTAYRVARYLQVHVFAAPPSELGAELRPLPQTATATTTRHSPPQTPVDDEGLVTARQSPNLEESLQLEAPSTTTTTSPKDTTTHTTNWLDESSPGADENRRQRRRRRPVIMGVGEQFLHGALYVFWQLKRQVDVVGFLVERACLWRKPRPDEQAQLQRLQLGSDGLEWFQDFYAAFLAILVQVYTLGLEWAPEEQPATPLRTNSTLLAGREGAEPLLKQAANKNATTGNMADVVGRVGGQVLANLAASKDVLMVSQLLVSSAIVVSLLMAVRRRDDGPLTLTLSMIGWASLFASRVIVLALAVVNLGAFSMFLLTGAHIFLISAWIYKIALDSHNNKPGESEEFEWNDEENDLKSAPGSPEPLSSTCATQVTSQWSFVQRATLLVQVFILFAIPSVFYWPIMFNLKLHYRPFKYLALIMSQNFILIALILFINRNMIELYFLAGAAALTLVGFLFISLYHCCKPSLTEYFARADELFNEADRSGVYFEFCSRVFKMPDLNKHCFRRLMNQRTEIVERDD